MAAEHPSHVDGLADIPGAAIASIGRESTVVCLSGQVRGTFCNLQTALSTLHGVSALFDPRWLIEIDATAEVD